MHKHTQVYKYTTTHRYTCTLSIQAYTSIRIYTALHMCALQCFHAIMLDKNVRPIRSSSYLTIATYVAYICDQKL